MARWPYSFLSLTGNIVAAAGNWGRLNAAINMLTAAARLNTLRLRQNGRHFPDDIFKCIFLNKNIWISIKISLNFVPGVRINNIPVLVQIMAWRRPGDKPLSEPTMVQFTDAYMRRWVISQKGLHIQVLNKIVLKNQRISIHCNSTDAS